MDRTVYECLLQTLSPEANVRMQAELTLRQLTPKPEFPLSLTRCATAPECSLPQRQAAIFSLKNYVDKHWSASAQRFEEPELDGSVKQLIRQQIVEGLSDSEKKIRVGAAYVISEIAQFDWPEDWPELFDYLLHLLKSGSPEQVQASMHVYSEFVRRDMTDQQMNQIIQLLPELYTIATKDQVHDIGTRARAVGVFKDCLEMFAIVSVDRPGAIDTYIKPYLGSWQELFVHYLRQPTVFQPDAPAGSINLSMKIEVLRAVKVANRFAPKDNNAVATIMDLIVQDLMTLCAPYTEGFVYSQEGQSWVVSTDDGESADLSLETYIVACLDFLSEFITRTVVRPYLVHKAGPNQPLEPQPAMIQLVNAVVPYLQVAQEQAEAWQDDIDQFIADEEHESLSFNVRTFAQDTIRSMLDKFPLVTVGVLGQVAPNFASQATQARTAGDPRWWVILEACLLAIGLAAEDMIETYQHSRSRVHLDLPGLFEHVVIQMAQCPEPFARGRAFIFTSQFSEILPPAVNVQYLQAAATALESADPLAVKISALKALDNFGRQADKDQIRPLLRPILTGIVRLQDQFTADTLLVALETLYVLMKIDASITAELEPVLGPFVLTVWQQHPANHLINSLTVDILAVLVSNPQCFGAFQARVVPLITDVMRRGPEEVEGGVVANALDLLSELIRNGPSPLPVGYVEEIFPVLVQLLRRSDDHAIMQNGQECFKYYVTKDLDHLARWQEDPTTGRTGLAILLEYVAFLLQPQQSESASFFVGDLIVKLIQKGYHWMAPHAASLIQVVLNRIASAQTSVFAQSLIAVMAHLIIADSQNTLAVVQGLTIEGRPALQLLVDRWCEEYESFNGVYTLKANAVAMRKLWEETEPALGRFLVKGDLTVTQNKMIMTRSRTANSKEQYSLIPAHAKIIKLFIADIQNDIDHLVAKKTEKLSGLADDGSDDDEWEDVDAEDLLAPADDYKDLIDLADFGADSFGDDDDDDDDEDLKQSPIYQLNLKEYLVNFLRELAANRRDLLNELVEKFLNANELVVVKAALT
ncbi:hypothetical protein H4R33_006397 [Dimargaris cristalligena]|nr:hypothetical protein H4R33_006397 [Dimargaris cristalligena]